MSGHSKWSTIKRQKEANDQARGKLFSRLTKAISVAVKTGGGPNPDTNHKLRVAIEAAKQANMPNSNIERALDKASSSAKDMEEVIYEGFGPENIAVLIEAATDNRNRTSQEIKNILEKSGGSLAGPGAVSYQFNPRGFLLIAKQNDPETQMLSLIDLGVEDLEDSEDGIELTVPPKELFDYKNKLEDNGFKVLKTSLIQDPVSFVDLMDKKAEKALNLLEALESHEDVQNIFSNLNIIES